jgi:Mn2+/Fe2+ NRAMP family transporter
MWDRAKIEAKWAAWTERIERVRRAVRPFQKRIALFLAVVGPGLIVSNVDNDAGGIYTYAQSGAQYGYLVLWSLIPMTIMLYVSLEMCSRMGAITGKGLSDLIREEFGFRVTFFLMALVLVINLGNVMAEFTGVAYSMDAFGVSKYISVPLAGLLVWALIVKGTAARVEKIFLAVCMVYLTYVASAFLAKPDWLVSVLYLLPPPLTRLIPEMKPVIQAPPMTASYFLILAGLVGTTIAPWQHFYLQAAVVEKKVGPRQYPTTRNDVTVGSISCMVIVFFIIVCTAATLHVNGILNVDNAGTAALALKPLAGKWASTLFAIGLLNASLFAASILPLSTSYVVCEAMGFESGVDHKFNDAKIFYGLYTALIVIGVVLILVLPNSWQNGILLLSQVGNEFLLLPIMVVILLLVNRRDLMGDYVNSRSFNWVAWVSTILLVVLTCVLLYTGIASAFKSP